MNASSARRARPRRQGTEVGSLVSTAVDTRTQSDDDVGIRSSLGREWRESQPSLCHHVRDALTRLSTMGLADNSSEDVEMVCNAWVEYADLQRLIKDYTPELDPDEWDGLEAPSRAINAIRRRVWPEAQVTLVKARAPCTAHVTQLGRIWQQQLHWVFKDVGLPQELIYLSREVAIVLSKISGEREQHMFAGWERPCGATDGTSAFTKMAVTIQLLECQLVALSKHSVELAKDTARTAQHGLLEQLHNAIQAFLVHYRAWAITRMQSLSTPYNDLRQLNNGPESEQVWQIHKESKSDEHVGTTTVTPLVEKIAEPLIWSDHTLPPSLHLPDMEQSASSKPIRRQRKGLGGLPTAPEIQVAGKKRGRGSHTVMSDGERDKA